MTGINQESAIVDAEIQAIINQETIRQESYIELIASENFTSKAVLAAQGSILTNKYAEGYPGHRFYCGCKEVDKAEILAQNRAKELFNCNFANVQPHSGSQANQAVYLALLKPGDVTLGMALDGGGHLTHGAAPNISGQWFKPVNYNVDPATYLINYENIEELALRCRPKLIIAGFSCYSRELDFARFRAIADKVGAYFLADIAHISGLIASGAHPNPFPHAHVVTSTTHKTLRGPRGGIILTNDENISKKIDRAVFPGLQGGPLMHVIAAKAVAFKEALAPEFKQYINQVIINARVLGETLKQRNYTILTGGTDNHIITLDLRPDKLTGKAAATALDEAGITANKNSIPFDPTSPFVTSGIRLGTPACTTRGFKEAEFKIVGNLIADILDGLKINDLQKGLKGTEDMNKLTQEVKNQARNLTNKFPIYKTD